MEEGIEKSLGGRPSKYDESYNEQAYKLCLLGATDTEIADFFNVATSTIYEWKNIHPQFSEAINAGKIKADMEIASSLYERAKGYDYTEEQALKLKRADGGGISDERVEIVTINKHVPPDPISMKFWLGNRRGWKDRKDVTTDDKPISLAAKTDEQIEEEIAAAQRRLNEHPTD